MRGDGICSGLYAATSTTPCHCCCRRSYCLPYRTFLREATRILPPAAIFPIFLIFSLFHIVVGSAWYFALPILVHKVSKKITATTAGAWAAATMMIIPIPSHWLQLLRFFGGNTRPNTIGLNSVLPVCVDYFIHLAVYHKSQANGNLWLLCLMPAVFYYLVRNLSYYMLPGAEPKKGVIYEGLPY